MKPPALFTAYLLFFSAYSHITENDLNRLSEQLSVEANVYHNASPDFASITVNFNPRLHPQIDVAIEAATVSDVQKTVCRPFKSVIEN